MKSRVGAYVLAATVLLAGEGHATPRWVAFDTYEPEGSPPRITVLSSSMSQTTVKIKIPGMWVKDTLIGGTLFRVLSIPECPGHLAELGRPQLPDVSTLVGIPPQSGVLLDTTVIGDTVLMNYLIFPNQPPLMDIGLAIPVREKEMPDDFVIDEPFYGTDAFYPATVFQKSPPRIWRDVRIIESHNFPTRFNPVTRQLHVYYEFLLEFSYAGIDPRNAMDSYPPYVLPQCHDSYRSAIANYEFLGIGPPELWPPPPNPGPGPSLPVQIIEGYLIIVADGYYDKLRELGFDTWKTKKGLIAKTVKQGDILSMYPGKDDTAAIKEFVAAMCTLVVDFTATGVADTGRLWHLLLVGDMPNYAVDPLYPSGIYKGYDPGPHPADATHIPTFVYTSPHVEADETRPGDYYYSCRIRLSSQDTLRACG